MIREAPEMNIGIFFFFWQNFNTDLVHSHDHVEIKSQVEGGGAKFAEGWGRNSPPPLDAPLKVVQQQTPYKQ